MAKYSFISLFPAVTLDWLYQVVIWVLCSLRYNRDPSEFNYLEAVVKVKFSKFTKDYFLKISRRPFVKWLVMVYH